MNNGTSTSNGSQTSRARRVAVIGGDGRHKHQQSWPEDYDVRCYSGDEWRRAVNSDVDIIVMLSKFLPHGAWDGIKASGKPWAVWERSFNELSRPKEFEKVVGSSRVPVQLMKRIDKPTIVSADGGTRERPPEVITALTSSPPTTVAEKTTEEKRFEALERANEVQRQLTEEHTQALILACENAAGVANKVPQNYREITGQELQAYTLGQSIYKLIRKNKLDAKYKGLAAGLTRDKAREFRQKRERAERAERPPKTTKTMAPPPPPPPPSRTVLCPCGASVKAFAAEEEGEWVLLTHWDQRFVNAGEFRSCPHAGTKKFVRVAPLAPPTYVPPPPPVTPTVVSAETLLERLRFYVNGVAMGEFSKDEAYDRMEKLLQKK